MHRRYFIAALTGVAIAPFLAPSLAAIPMPGSEIPRLWRNAEQASNAREFLAMVPPSWGPIPWLFEGQRPARYGGDERVQLRITGAYDTVQAGLTALAIEYAYRRESGAGWVQGTRILIKGRQ